MINIGYGNYVMVDRIVAVLNPDSAPLRRLIRDFRGKPQLLDATVGRKTRSLLMLDSGHVVLSSHSPDTVVQKVESRK
ncbi:MAG: DUF370 domain-containing protein [Candidatus Eremiobacteraeota bacterium]|nr:DUF370 domain-containing protein [Candidatus Eremiobacteraeota bacterium]